MKLRLEADCDVTKMEIPEDSSTTDSEDGLGCFGECATLPFQPNSSEETTCGRRIVLELTDWSRDVLVEVAPPVLLITVLLLREDGIPRGRKIVLRTIVVVWRERLLQRRMPKSPVVVVVEI